MAWSSNSGTRSVPYKLQQACFKRHEWTCQACWYEGTPNKGELHADHVINRAAGGTNDLDNLITLCVPCHELKTAHERASGITEAVRRRQGRRRPRRHPADAL